MNRHDLQRMAEAKYEDALFLFRKQRHSSAYYLSGYAIEFALKAVIARHILPETIPDRSMVSNLFTHKLETLIGLAELKEAQKHAFAEDRELEANWGVVANWSPESRYEMIDPFKADELIQAVGNREHGVLQWLKRHW